MNVKCTSSMQEDSEAWEELETFDFVLVGGRMSITEQDL